MLATQPKNIDSAKGLSLIEVVVVLAVVATALTMGVPSMMEWLQNTQIRTAAESVVNGMQLARTEAVRRNASVEFSLTSPGAAGNTGWQVKLVDGTVLQSKPAGEASKNALVTVVPADTVAYTFTGFGRGSANGLNADGSVLLTRVDVTSGASPPSGVAWRNLQVRITSGGEVRMCDPNITNTADPRAC